MADFMLMIVMSRHRLYEHTVTEPSKQSCRDQLTETVRGTLDGSTDNHDTASGDDGALPAQQIAKPYRRTSAEKASQRVATDGDALDVRRLAFGPTGGRIFGVDLRKELEERFQGEQAAHDTCHTRRVSGGMVTCHSPPDRNSP